MGKELESAQIDAQETARAFERTQSEIVKLQRAVRRAEQETEALVEELARTHQKRESTVGGVFGRRRNVGHSRRQPAFWPDTLLLFVFRLSKLGKLRKSNQLGQGVGKLTLEHQQGQAVAGLVQKGHAGELSSQQGEALRLATMRNFAVEAGGAEGGPRGKHGLLWHLRVKRKARMLRRSALFDATWYLDRYNDVAASHMDAAKHFVIYGLAEGRAPNAEFERIWQRVNDE